MCSKSHLTSVMIRPGAPPSSIVREHTHTPKGKEKRKKEGNETALNSKPLCMCVCVCFVHAETGISSMRDHARARARMSRPVWVVAVVVVGSRERRCVSFQRRHDLPCRSNDVLLLLPLLRWPINVVVSFLFTLLLMRKRKSLLFFLSLSYCTDPIAVRVLWFLNDDSAPGGRHEPRDITWLVIFFLLLAYRHLTNLSPLFFIARKFLLSQLSSCVSWVTP